jgi:hypothetical protein
VAASATWADAESRMVSSSWRLALEAGETGFPTSALVMIRQLVVRPRASGSKALLDPIHLHSQAEASGRASRAGRQLPLSAECREGRRLAVPRRSTWPLGSPGQGSVRWKSTQVAGPGPGHGSTPGRDRGASQPASSPRPSLYVVVRRLVGNGSDLPLLFVGVRCNPSEVQSHC